MKVCILTPICSDLSEIYVAVVFPELMTEYVIPHICDNLDTYYYHTISVFRHDMRHKHAKIYINKHVFNSIYFSILDLKPHIYSNMTVSVM